MEEKILNRLLNLSDKICLEIEHLANLSALNLENNDKYKEHIETLKSYVEQESNIINTINCRKLQKIVMLLNEKNEESISANRLFDLLDEKIDELLIDEENDQEENNLSSDDELPDIELEDDDETETSFLNKYYEPEDDLEKYIDYTIDKVSIIALKKMHERIYQTQSSNKQDNQYKKTLLNYLRQFKYYVFSIDSKLEKIGIEYDFDIDKIPYLKQLEIDVSPIYHNECIQILYKLYLLKIKDNQKVSEVSELLFDTICFEEYLNELDNDYITNLITLCDELNNRYNTDNYGIFCYKKLLKKKN